MDKNLAHRARGAANIAVQLRTGPNILKYIFILARFAKRWLRRSGRNCTYFAPYNTASEWADEFLARGLSADALEKFEGATNVAAVACFQELFVIARQ
jgi:hypothetical protein